MPLPLTQALSPKDNHLQMKIYILQGSPLRKQTTLKRLDPCLVSPCFLMSSQGYFLKLFFIFIIYIHSFTLAGLCMLLWLPVSGLVFLWGS